MMHSGHIRLLERAKMMGDYLIVGVTADDFDKKRGKINVKQSLIERIESIRDTGLADEIIVEEYEGQKIDDIRRLNVDIFTVGSDWAGKFDYLSEYCEVIYLERTEGVSSSELRAKERMLRFGYIGGGDVLKKYYHESKYVNGLISTAIYMVDENNANIKDFGKELEICMTRDALYKAVDAIYVMAPPRMQYDIVKDALMQGKHVLCEAPVAIRTKEVAALLDLARRQNVVLMEAIKTAYSTAYNRLQLLIKSGEIGDIVSVDVSCTSLRSIADVDFLKLENCWNSMFAWGPTGMLPIFQLLGTKNFQYKIWSKFADETCKYDLFSKVNFSFPHAVSSLKVGQGAKAESDLIISGTKGYLYVPAPWWKTDYFEIRYENPNENKRYFYQLEGEGIRYELVAFVKAINSGLRMDYIDSQVVVAIANVLESFENGDVIKI